MTDSASIPGAAGQGVQAHCRGYTGLTIETLLAYKTLAVGVWIALFLLAERLRPMAVVPAEAKGLARLGRNGGLWLLNAVLSPLLVIPVSLWASQHTLGWRMPEWQGGWFLLLDLLLLDFLIYWWHRANHELPLLWRFHEVHHLDRFLDASSALRFHFGEVLLSAGFRALVIILLDIPLASVLVFEALVLMASVFHHSNLRLPAGLEKFLARLVVTPSIHWVHHHAVRRNTDSNYATILSLWDRLFGSRSATRRTPDLPIGLEGVGRDDDIRALLMRPFRTRP
ncbi:MAG: sterol desaturase family protein [Alphaproteobacteria bacterium]|nr:sterol desaturase family protein [Alphaproteobacteria bacterium]MBU0799103.1 sterol desaturase family protein [Alphaproteobacteria bacterium]MBU0888701.1 sterol desaturase family protein [Alphaproteobacteria bacterium]MBU1813565.1 sterol desaturase family protein [Alphaproteobacteria bacterium]